MGDSSAARKLRPTPRAAVRGVPAYGGGPPAGPPREPVAPVGNGRIAILMLLGAETMFFTGLIAAYMVLRGSAPMWPPPDLPRLPIAVTWLNTFVLAGSCWTMHRARVAMAQRSPWRLEKALTATALMGTAFLAVQGTEWIRLVGHGLRLSSGVYGATFYVLIGVHGLHVLAAVAWLIWVLHRGRTTRFSTATAVAVDLAGIYWYFVGALWLVLFPMVYLL
jgi:heme/copper-type cytochrome/quinol oxidase subunit 3